MAKRHDLLLPTRPEPNGSEFDNYVAAALDHILQRQSETTGWFRKQITLGNIVVLGTIMLSGAFAYFKGEAHLADAAHIHWTATELEDAIDRRDSLTRRVDSEKLDQIANDVAVIKQKIIFFRSSDDVEWQRLRDRVLVLEHGAKR